MKEMINNFKDEIVVKPEMVVNSESNNDIDIEKELLSLNEYITRSENEGIAITSLDIESRINSLGLSIEDLLDNKIKDGEIIDINKNLELGIEESIIKKSDNFVNDEKNRDVVSLFKNMMQENEGDSKTALSRIRDFFGSNSKLKFNLPKFAVLTLILFFKFNGAHAEDNSQKVKEKKQNTIELGTEKNNELEGGDDKIYKYGVEDLENNDKKIKISATNYFDTDKSDLKNKDILSGEFDKFFASINDDNFEKIINHDWIFKGSSDERSRPLGNENLTKDRINEFVKLFDERRTNFDFSKQSLSLDKINKILDKKVIESYPKGGEEKGVTYLTGLTNPNTGEHYTTEEINIIKNNKAEYQKLLDKCRYTSFEVNSSMFEISAYDECIILADNSESMGETQKNMAFELKGLDEDKQVTVGYFSSKLLNTEKRSNSKEAAEVLSKMSTNGSSHELSVYSASEYLYKVAIEEKDKKEKGEHISSKIMYIATDEPIQDANKVKSLIKLAKETNTTVKFLVFYEKGTKVIKLDLESLDEQVTNLAELNIKAAQEQAYNNLLNQQKRLEQSADKVLAMFSNPIYYSNDTYGALETIKFPGVDKIDNSENGMKILKENLLDDNNFSKLLELRDHKIFKDFVNTKLIEMNAISNLEKANELSIENELKKNITINVVSDYQNKI